MVDNRRYCSTRAQSGEVSGRLNASVTIAEYVHSNHGTFYYNQLAALQILVGDTNGAQSTINEYFNNAYLGQIAQNGDQVSLMRHQA